jgi:hypothetical protein
LVNPHPARSQDFTRIGFCFVKLAYTETNRDHLKLLLDAEREDVVLSLRFIANYRARPDGRRVT